MENQPTLDEVSDFLVRQLPEPLKQKIVEKQLLTEQERLQIKSLVKARFNI